MVRYPWSVVTLKSALSGGLHGVIPMRGQVDLEDAILAPLFALTSGVEVGIASVSAFGIALSDPAFNLGATDFTWALVLGLVAPGVAFATNVLDRLLIRWDSPQMD